MRNTKIIFFVPFYPFVKGGAEYQAKIIALALQERGYDVVYISMGLATEKVLEYEGFKIYQLPVKKTKLEQVLLYRNFSNKAQEIITNESPSFIYQRILNTFTFRLAKYAFKKKIPFVLHIADNYSIEFDKGVKSLLKKRLFDQIMACNPHVIAQTGYQYEVLEGLGKTPSALIPNMHPPIQTKAIRKDMSALLWIGTIRPVKQLEVFLDLAEKMDETDYVFHVVGGLPKSVYGADLGERMQRMENVRYHGEKENVFINEFLQQTALLVNTSVSEGFSNTFIQAWMCGTPVVALNSDPDNIMAQNGIGIDCKGNPDKMPGAIVKILDEKKYSKVCEKALSVANRTFSVSGNVQKLESILTEITGKINGNEG